MSLNVYEVELVQFSRVDYGHPMRETERVIARSAQEAIKRAIKIARHNGFYRSMPIEIEKMEIVAWEVKR